jgi:monoamine oxidase
MDTSPMVVVVGAGLAGLAAARELRDEGAQVVVVEARERVGGRVWSATLENRVVVELGAEWIAEDDDAVLGLAERFELPVLATGVDYGRRESEGLTLEEQESFLVAANRARAALGDVKGMSLGELLDRVPGSEAVRRALRMRLQGTCARDLSDVAARVVDEERALAPGEGRYFRLGRGNEELATELAYSLDDVRLGFAVDAVVERAEGVWVRSGTLEIEAAAAWGPGRPPPAARLRFEPGLPPEFETALRELPMGVASKLAVATRGRPTLRARQSTELPMWCWVANGKGDEPRRCLTSFAGSEPAQGPLGTMSGRVGPWLDRLRAMNPDLELVGEPLWYAWADDPFTLGAYSAWDDRSWDRHELFQTTVGRVAFAGEHTAGPRHYATMEGALRSGVRAARQVSELLG